MDRSHPFADYARKSRPPRRRGSYPSPNPFCGAADTMPAGLKSYMKVKSSGYGKSRPTRSATQGVRPPRRGGGIAAQVLAVRASSQPVGGCAAVDDDDAGSRYSDDFEPDLAADEHAEAEVAESAPPEDPVAVEEAPVTTRGSVKKGKIVFDPCLDLPAMKVSPEVRVEPFRKFSIDFTCRVIEYVMGMHGFKQTKKDPNWLLWWTSGSTVRASMLQTMSPHQRVNHFPRSSELSRKDRMSENIYRMQQQHGHKSFDLVPKTFVLPRQIDLLHEEASAHPEILWIVKPIASSCGRGIFVTDTVDKIPDAEHLVVSQYIANPLLIDGYKFDLRIYVLVTSFDPLRIYVFEEGLVRFSTEKYEVSKESLKNSCVHLTNYSVNKLSDKFDDDEEEGMGHKWSISAFRDHLSKCGINDKLLFDRINDLVIRTLLAVEPSVRSACGMYQTHHSSCFELLGFDVLVEDNLRPWLVEVNLSPSLSCPNGIDRTIKSKLIADTLSIVGLTARNPNANPKKKPKPKKPPVAEESKYSYAGATSSFSQMLMSEVNASERKILKDVQHEVERSRQGGFKCIFPTQHSVTYSGYFDGPRPLNALVARMLWAQAGQTDLSASKAKVISAKSGMVPFWKEDAASRKVLTSAKGNVADDKQGKLKRSVVDCSPKISAVRLPSSKSGISPIMCRLHSLPGSKELRDRVQELQLGKSGTPPGPPSRSGDVDKLPELYLDNKKCQSVIPTRGVEGLVDVKEQEHTVSHRRPKEP